MYCTTCGNKFIDDPAFCNQCGAPTGKTSNQTIVQPRQSTSVLIGYSSKINDPTFNKYSKKSTTWSFLFAGILAVIAIIAFPIYGNASGDIDWPVSLFYGMGIGGMFLLIALLQTLKKRLDKTWDGEVIYKDAYRQKTRYRDGHVQYNNIYILKIKKDTGGTKKHKWRNIPGPYHYYNIGDKIRHHKGFYYYEKYDKSKDNQIMCAACLSFHDISENVCNRCKCPLLK